MENKFCTFTAFESSKDFMIAVEALIKPLGYQKKMNSVTYPGELEAIYFKPYTQ